MSDLVLAVPKMVTSILSPKAPETPVIPEPKVMPIADEEALAKARRRQAGKKTTGRASTVLTAGKKLGSGGSGSTTVGG